MQNSRPARSVPCRCPRPLHGRGRCAPWYRPPYAGDELKKIGGNNRRFCRISDVNSPRTNVHQINIWRNIGDGTYCYQYLRVTLMSFAACKSHAAPPYSVVAHAAASVKGCASGCPPAPASGSARVAAPLESCGGGHRCAALRLVLASLATLDRRTDVRLWAW